MFGNTPKLITPTRGRPLFDPAQITTSDSSSSNTEEARTDGATHIYDDTWSIIRTAVAVQWQRTHTPQLTTPYITEEEEGRG